MRPVRNAALLGGLLGVAPVTACAQAPEPSSFAGLVQALSEPQGYFDTDNLISNESSYLHAIDALRRAGVSGGAYVGVGPDQNFAYIAAIQPRVAYLIDIRRDNLLLHLVFKALFEAAPTRVEYLALLFGRPPPADPAQWRTLPVDSLAAWVDRTPATVESIGRSLAVVQEGAARTGLPLSVADRATMERFHRAFIRDGLDLQFTSQGRAPRPDYPDYRRLLTERTRAGQQASLLARDADYQYVRRMQREDRIIPVVGDLAGSRALRAIGQDARRRGVMVTAVYASNVEFYLAREGTIEQFAANVQSLPRSPRGVIIRSWFSRFSRPHPMQVAGYNSVQIVQRFSDFLSLVDAGNVDYWELVTTGIVTPE